MPTTSLNRVRYAGLDFDTHEDEILARLQVKFASVYNDFAVSSLGIMLIDIFSFGLDTISFYLDRRATDNFISTARTRASVARLARQLGYKMGASTASAVDVDVSLSVAQTFAVTLPIGFQFNGPNGLIFEAKESATWAIGDTSEKTVTASEGETLVATFTSDGTPNQVFDIASVPDGKFILGPGTANISQIIVTVDGEVYTEEELLVFGETAQFELGYNDDPSTLRFGDGIAGKIPPDGAEIRIEFFATSGVNGQATESTIEDSVLSLVVGFTPVELIINNPLGTNGGSDPETIDSAKANAPTVFKSRGVNVTTEDYEARSKSFVDPVFGAVAVAQAVTVRGSSDDAFLASRLASINAAASSMDPTVTTAVATITGSTDNVTASIVDARADDALMTTEFSTIAASITSAESANSDVRVAAGVAQSSQSGLTTEIASLQTAVDGVVSAGASDDMLPTTKAAIDNIIAALTGRSNEIGTQASSILGSSSTLTTELDVASVARVAADTNRAGIDADITDIETETAIIVSTSATLDTDITDIGTSVATLTGEVSTHVDSFLSNECQSNLVEVPILALDSEGFYVVPTIGLQQALQTHLDTKKEVTQVIKVTGASGQLIEADITVLVGILTGFNEATVRSQVEAEILSVLRGRKFGATLRLSELYAPIAPEADDITIDGVEYVNINVTGPVGSIDSDGNLPINEFEVVTRGTISITSVVVEKTILT